MPTLKTLSVYPNPYLQLDHEGRPAGACPYDPLEHKGDQLHYVGARRVTTEVRKENAARGESAVHDYTWEFATEPETVPATDYYRRAIRNGEVFAADLKTWKEAGCDPRTFLDPKLALLHAKDGAVARWEREYGEAPKAAEHWLEFHDASRAELAAAAKKSTAPSAPNAAPSAAAPANAGKKE